MTTANTAAKRVRLERTETEIAVLQNEVKNLNEKIDDLKLHMKELQDCVNNSLKETRSMIAQLKTDSDDAHNEIVSKVAGLEKIKWMLMGAAAVIGATGAEAFKMFMQHIAG